MAPRALAVLPVCENGRLKWILHEAPHAHGNQCASRVMLYTKATIIALMYNGQAQNGYKGKR